MFPRFMQRIQAWIGDKDEEGYPFHPFATYGESNAIFD
jgi:hypothetical protein